MNTNVALITGASSGIGKQLAFEHAKTGGDLILVARRLDNLEKIKQEIENQFKTQVHLIQKDLSLINAAEELHSEVKALGLRVQVLINNAGFGGHGKFQDRKWDDDKEMIQLNVITLTGLCRLFLPEMLVQGGKILNVASVAGFVPGPYQAIYFATKAFVINFTESLADELKGSKVTVTALCPGATETEFFDKANLRNTRLIKNAQSANFVAAFGYASMLKNKTIAIPGFVNKATASAPRFFPRKMVTFISRKVMEKLN